MNMGQMLKPYQIQQIKERYKPGTRIELNDQMQGESIPAGMRGTVDMVDDIGDIHMKWDNGRTLGIVPGEDQFKVIAESPEESMDADQNQGMGGMNL